MADCSTRYENLARRCRNNAASVSDAADRTALLLMAERYERRAAEAATSPALFPGRLSLEKPGAVSAGRTGGSFILTEAVEAA